MAKIVRTKAELKRAVADKTDEIAIAPELEETTGWIMDALRLPWEKRVALLCFFGAGLIALLFVPAPEYQEGFLAAILSIWGIVFKTVIGTVVVAALVYLFSRIIGINWMLIFFLLIQSVLFGPVTAVRMLCRYDVVDTGVRTAPGSGVCLRYRKK